MTDKQAVMDALQRLPENASLEEIAAELQIMKAVRKGRTDIKIRHPSFGEVRWVKCGRVAHQVERILKWPIVAPAPLTISI